jgi:hypothetical protein
MEKFFFFSVHIPSILHAALVGNVSGYYVCGLVEKALDDY